MPRRIGCWVSTKRQGWTPRGPRRAQRLGDSPATSEAAGRGNRLGGAASHSPAGASATRGWSGEGLLCQDVTRLFLASYYGLPSNLKETFSLVR
jgi:hypothetical protein